MIGDEAPYRSPGCHALVRGVVEEHSRSGEARWRLTVERREERMQT